jgi:glucose-6-phosphate 1-dehydrogenase
MNIEQAIKQTSPFTLTIFGITGDLSGRMLLPALYNLALQDLLPESLRIVGITRRSYTVDKLLGRIKKTIVEEGGAYDEAVLENLGKRIELVTMDLTNIDGYIKLRQRLDAIEGEIEVCANRLFYMAIPAQLFDDVVGYLGDSGLNRSCPHGTGQSRLLVEKPFGYDLDSAQTLVKRMRTHFEERQIYRIDHFLTKETAQNILTFRFKNALFKSVWDKHCISRILISATEALDIEGRANFYEQTGALRDMIQGHVLQILALITMDMPDVFTSKAIHEKKRALLVAVEPAAYERATRGQYNGYRTEVKNPDSYIETYAALRLSIANDRWKGVPILLRTGKALTKKTTDIKVIFTDHDEPKFDNILTIRLVPNEGVSLHLRAKKPGFDDVMQDVSMDFYYSNSFAGIRQPTAYERVLVDAFRGDQTLFATSEEVLANWRIIEPLLVAWGKDDSKGLESYAKGSWGPIVAAWDSDKYQKPGK